MSATKITRRRLLAGASGLAIAGQLPVSANARPIFLRGGKGSGGPTTGFLNGTAALAFYGIANSIPATTDGRSLTFVNTSASPTPANVPIQAAMWFPPGAVPAGSIAVPQVGGVDQTYNLVNPAPPWGDGSFKGGIFYISKNSAIAGNGSTQITFDVHPGTYSNTSSITTATVTSETDFNIQLTNCHTARASIAIIPAQDNKQATLQYSPTISGGQINGIKVWHFKTGEVGVTANITQPDSGATAASITFENGVPTIVSPGSGFTYLGGTGNVSISLNTIVGLINSNGNRTGGCRIEQYAKGPACDAWWIVYAVPNVPHFWVSFYVERWKKSDGSLLDYKIVAEFGTGLVDSVNIIRNLTFDLDFRNGSTVIVGASSGDTRFQTMTNFVAQSAKTLTDVGKPYWLNNHAAFTAIEMRRTQAEAMYYRSTGMSFPVIKTIIPQQLPPTIVSAYDAFAGFDGISRLLSYQPYANGGIRVPLNDTGGFYGEPSMHPVHSLVWINWYNGNTTDASKWMRNQRVAAAHSTCMPILGSAIYEPTTMFLPNSIPIATQTFTGMVPSRYLNSAAAIMAIDYAYGTTDPIQAIGDAVFLDNSHAVNYTYGAYILEGEMHQLNAVLNASVAGMFGRGYTNRSQKIGTQEYHGYIFAWATYNCRIQFRKARSDIYASAVAPLTWADGSASPETEMIRFYTKGTFDFLNDAIPHVGTIWRGIDQVAVTKSYDTTGTGLITEAVTIIEFNENTEVITFFMEYYGFEAFAHGAWLHQGTPIGDGIAAFRDHHAIAMVGNYGGPGSHYKHNAYRRRSMHGPYPSTPIVMSSGYDVTSPSIASNPTSWLGGYPAISFTSGSNDITIANGGVYSHGASTMMANGSRIFLTTSLDGPPTQNYFLAPPSPYNMTTAYYWLQGANPTIGKLCTGLDGGGNPDPATAAAASATVGPVGLWVVLNNLPADNSGLVAIDDYYPEFAGSIRAAKAFGLPAMGGLRDAAITTINTIGTASGKNWNEDIKYGHDDNLS